MTGAQFEVAIRKSYEADFTLDINFTVSDGITILFGASGSGKSTLLNCIAGLVTPESGRIALGDRVLFDAASRIDLPVAQRKVGYLLQDLALFPHMTIRRNIAYGLDQLTRAARTERIEFIVESFRISHLMERKPGELSGGERQRAALARSLVTEPAALLLDEPLSALDQVVKSAIINDLREWNEAHQIPIIYVTHAPEEAYALGVRMIVLESGRMIAHGTPQEVLKAPRSERMAQLAGFENVFDAELTAVAEASGTMTCRLNDTPLEIEVPLTATPRDGRVRVAIRAGDIMLAVTRPLGLSARNVIKGRIKSIQQEGLKLIAIVEVEGVMFEVHLTPNAREELGLKAEGIVWVIIKTYSCHLVDSNDH
ncbi:MAG TPA: molybdenum ABC transporter ATP-binding protein [Candidatus Binataceae bacterium]|nr:molybdenum ABC transporter ATP-binding protein [Candidatus Binataceae bacterium]